MALIWSWMLVGLLVLVLPANPQARVPRNGTFESCDTGKSRLQLVNVGMMQPHCRPASNSSLQLAVLDCFSALRVMVKDCRVIMKPRAEALADRFSCLPLLGVGYLQASTEAQLGGIIDRPKLHKFYSEHQELLKRHYQVGSLADLEGQLQGAMHLLFPSVSFRKHGGSRKDKSSSSSRGVGTGGAGGRGGGGPQAQPASSSSSPVAPAAAAVKQLSEASGRKLLAGASQQEGGQAQPAAGAPGGPGGVVKGPAAAGAPSKEAAPAKGPAGAAAAAATAAAAAGAPSKEAAPPKGPAGAAAAGAATAAAGAPSKGPAPAKGAAGAAAAATAAAGAPSKEPAPAKGPAAAAPAPAKGPAAAGKPPQPPGPVAPGPSGSSSASKGGRTRSGPGSPRANAGGRSKRARTKRGGAASTQEPGSITNVTPGSSGVTSTSTPTTASSHGDIPGGPAARFYRDGATLVLEPSAECPFRFRVVKNPALLQPHGRVPGPSSQELRLGLKWAVLGVVGAVLLAAGCFVAASRSAVNRDMRYLAAAQEEEQQQEEDRCALLRDSTQASHQDQGALGSAAAAGGPAAVVDKP